MSIDIRLGIAFAGLTIVGCSAANSQRQACYAQAEGVEMERAVAECPGVWSTCPSRPDILAELKASEASCP